MYIPIQKSIPIHMYHSISWSSNPRFRQFTVSPAMFTEQSERAYTLQTFPLGILRGLVNALFHGHSTGFLRVGAIVVGLTMTIAGYLRGCMVRRTLLLKDVCSGASIEWQQSLQVINDE